MSEEKLTLEEPTLEKLQSLRLKTLEEAEGKVVRKIASDVDEHLGILFEDLTVLVLAPNRGHEDELYIDVHHDLSPYMARDLGIITYQQYKLLIEEQQKVQAESLEQRERRQYERLKAKFEPENPS